MSGAPQRRGTLNGLSNVWALVLQDNDDPREVVRREVNRRKARDEKERLKKEGAAA